MGQRYSDQCWCVERVGNVAVGRLGESGDDFDDCMLSSVRPGVHCCDDGIAFGVRSDTANVRQLLYDPEEPHRSRPKSLRKHLSQTI